MIGVASSGNTEMLQGSFDHATKPDCRPGSKLRIEFAEHQQLRHEAAEMRNDRLPECVRIAPENGNRPVRIVRIVPRRACKGFRQRLDHGDGRPIAYFGPIRRVADVLHARHDESSAPRRMVSRRWSSFASNSGATPLHSRSRGTILLRTPMPRASA